MGDRPETARLRPVLAASPDLVDDALRALFPGPDPTVNLGGIRMAVDQLGGALDASEMVMRLLEKHGGVDRFVGFLRARGIDLAPTGPGALWDTGDAVPGFVPDPAVADSDFPEDALQDFLPRAKAFRCRIRIDGAIRGSGAFVSARLVMTAGHVIAPLTAALAARAAGIDAPLPKVEVLASDGSVLAARHAWHRPEYPGEHQGALPPAAMRDRFCDVALLRVAAPVGVSFGHLVLPDAAPDWTGDMRLALVHFPDGVQTGFCAGWITRSGPGDLRLRHSIGTEGGSSGGPGFDRQMRFLGLHQGRRKGFGSLVPFDLYAQDAEFRACLAGDRPPAYLWSLDGTLAGRLVIGRKAFFSAVAAMLDAPQGLLRGIWVKRDDTADTTGLGFSFQILRAFLDRNQPPDAPVRHRCVAVATGLGTSDLIAAVATACLPETVASPVGPQAHPAAPRVLSGDTDRSGNAVRSTDAGHPTAAGHSSDAGQSSDADRARALCERLAASAADRGECLWICFENPTAGMTHDVQVQLEYLIRDILLHPALRLILTGFETVDHGWLRVFSTPDEARSADGPGVMVDYVGRFSLGDVEITARQMCSDLGIDLKPAEVLALLRLATAEAKTLGPGLFAPDQVGKVADLLRSLISAVDGKP